MSAPATFRLVSYNVRKAVGTDRRRDPERIALVLASLAPDVAIVQEADLRLGQRVSALPQALVHRHTGLVPVDLARSPVSLGWHGIAVFIHPGTEVEGIERLDLPGLEPRGAVIVDLALPAGRVRVVGVHMGLLRSSRRKQLSRILDHLATLPPRPTVIGGDFNEISTTVGLGRLAAKFRIESPGPSFHARRPFAALDRFAHDAGLRLLNTGVLRDDLSRRASDHLPVWAECALEAGPGAKERPEAGRAD
ncbi:endonuclease/exonuclease/phosphatase family protein [Oceaniglobus roseus]|uniref:endonuclease/exonuclease/phosphatase family protein n=1 Tax=Oceaniglobus roseus TaxID=1737570 RepID=UPI000C7F14C1|nr:endonuclease/exonuclease/phosphatase family protein [Kandeliimicrobium roseum]